MNVLPAACNISLVFVVCALRGDFNFNKSDHTTVHVAQTVCRGERGLPERRTDCQPMSEHAFHGGYVAVDEQASVASSKIKRSM